MSRDDDGGGYDDRHRAFLQAFMSRSTLKYDEAKPILAAIWSAFGKKGIPL
jgi:non-structural maintenance of chromosomes element 1